MQCGLCAIVAGLFRRAMCIAGSRRGSGESAAYQELPPQPEDQRRNSGVMLDHSPEQNALMLRIAEEANALGQRSPSSPEDEDDEDDEYTAKKNTEMYSGLDDLERLLLAKLDVSQYRPKHIGRFLTMHKRRRKRLVTRSLNDEPGLLDDVSHGQVQCVLQKVTNWKFNAFTLETATGGRSLPVLCVHLFHWYGLLEHFNLDVVRVWKLFTLIEEGYHSTNPYHNSIHAADVTQAMHCFLQERQIRQNLSYLEIMASLIAAVTHDLDHPGVNQPFLVATSNHLAALYENTSVLENHHWRSAIGCLLESGISEQLPDSVKPELQRQISSLILATDITRQQEFLTRFKQYLDNQELDMKQPEHRHFILQIALKCADISNPCRPWDISNKWSHKVCEEFFRQGDYERQLNLPVTPLCDRHSTSISKIQVGFFKFVVLPLYEEWHRFLNDGFSHLLMKYLKDNQKQWELLIQKEAAAVAAAAQATQDSTTSDVATDVIEASECTEEDSGSLELPVPSPGLAPPPRDRRHSVPLGVTRSLSLAPRPTTARRESLPGGGSASVRIPRLPSPQITTSSISPVTSNNTTGSFGCTERPVSAENLLPDTSIASIANSREASRLSSLVQQQPWETQLLDQQQSQRQGTLTRQQTFPPLQPFARTRYMSTTAEMSQCCTEVLLEADSSSSRSCSPAVAAATDMDCLAPIPQMQTSLSAGAGELRRHSTPAQSKSKSATNGAGRRFTTIPLTQELGQQQDLSHKVFFIGSPPDSPPRHASATPSSDSGSGSVGSEPRRSVDSVSLPGNKRDYSDSTREKSSKMLKLMKENVDPRIEGSLALSNRRSSNQSWARRRGSAPVALLAKLEDTSASNRPVDSSFRRGSVPADIATPNGGVNRIGLSVRTEKLPSNKRRSSLPHEATIGNLSQFAADRENYPPNNNNNNNNNNNTGSNNNGFSRLGHEVTITTTTTTTATILTSRRGSVPADISELRRSSGSCKRNNRSNSKKLLRRRSSGGPEMFACAAENENLCIRKRNETPAASPATTTTSTTTTATTTTTTKRRGSLPVEMLALRFVHR